MCAAVLFALGLLCACEDPLPEPERPEPPPERREPAPTAAADDPLEGLDEPATPDEVVAPPAGTIAAPGTIAAAAPDRGCVAVTDGAVKVWARPGPATIVASGASFVVAGYAPGESSGEDAYLVQLAPDVAPRPIRRIALDPPATAGRVAAPGLAAAAGGRLVLAVLDGRGRVRATEIDPNDPLAEIRLKTLAEAADSRFAPAVAALARTRLVAWTDGTGTPMRVRLAVLGLDGTVASRHDVTPESMGASAPTFGAGMSPALYFLDARAGVSPIVRVPIGADGTPQASAVARPVGTVTAPPRLAVARGDGRVWAAYTAVGNAAATAVGYLPLDGTDTAPAAIVPGTGYGPLHVSAASAPGAAIFAADAPKDTPPTSPREVHVRLVDEDGVGPALTLQAPDGTARHASIARGAHGIAGVAFTAGDGVYVAWIRCDD